VVEMKKNWKSAEQGSGWSGVELKLSSRLEFDTTSAVTTWSRSDSMDLTGDRRRSSCWDSETYLLKVTTCK
jgi:hypothetical protein